MVATKTKDVEVFNISAILYIRIKQRVEQSAYSRIGFD